MSTYIVAINFGQAANNFLACSKYPDGTIAGPYAIQPYIVLYSSAPSPWGFFMSYTYKHSRPAITADCIVFSRDEEGLKVLLIQRGQEPFKGQWAFPGGFAEVGESLDDTAARELEEETGLRNIPLQQLYTFSRPDRDPREHIITVAYYAIIDLAGQEVKASSDARNAEWFSIDELPELAFDHEEIFSHAYNRIMEKQ